MIYKIHKLNVSYYFLNINIKLKINLNTFVLLCNILGPYIVKVDTNYRSYKS